MSEVSISRLAPSREPGPVAAIAVSGVLAAAALLLRWRGGDLPAQVFRADMFRHHGFVLWNNFWFGGHATLDYSVIVPVVESLLGPVVVGAMASVASAYFADRLLHAHFGPSATVGALWFALSTVTNVAVGRVTFGVGVALGLAALLALQRGRGPLAVAAALLCTLASPVAGVMLAIAATAWGSMAARRAPMTAIVVAAIVVPLGVVAVLFPGSGVFPFGLSLLAWTLFVCAVVACALPREQHVLRRAVALYALACLADFAVPNALGANITRLAQYGAGPLLACALWPHRRRVLVAVAVPLLVWQWYPAIDGIALAGEDPSTSAAFYAPLTTFLARQSHLPMRIEIPVTRHHWESVYVGDTQPLARGWERQLDRTFNGIFYDGSLDARSYERWLTNLGVDYVALPRAPLDPTAVTEAQLLSTGLPFLRPVWHDRDWQVWRFDASPGLISGPATLTQIGPDSFTINATGTGDVVVRVRASEHWSVPAPACTTSNPSGWTVLRGMPRGVSRITQSLRRSRCD